jgi:hypothetical protein
MERHSRDMYSRMHRVNATLRNGNSNPETRPRTQKEIMGGRDLGN